MLVSEIMECPLCIGISNDEVLSGSRPIFYLYIYRHIIGVYTECLI